MPVIDRRVLQAVRAAADGDIETLKRLHSVGVNLSLGDYDDRTPLHLACAEGHEDVVRFLLHECNVDVSVKDRWGKTAYQQAQMSEKKSIVEIFDETKIFQAVNAASRGDIETLRRLANDGLDLSNGDYDGRTPLHLACARGKQAVVRYLMQGVGVDINKQDCWGQTPMAEAKRNGHEDIVQIFHEEKILEAINAASNGQLDVLKRLKKEGIDLGKGDYDYRTPLHLACAEGKVEIVKYLLYECHVRVDCKDRWGVTPVEQAIKSGHKDLENVFKDEEGFKNMTSSLFNA